MLILDKIVHKDMFVHKQSNVLCGCIEEPIGNDIVLLTDNDREVVFNTNFLQDNFMFFNPRTRQVEEFIMMEVR